MGKLSIGRRHEVLSDGRDAATRAGADGVPSPSRLGALLDRLPGLRDLIDILMPERHPVEVTRQRVDLIIARVRQIAGVFAILTVVWIGIDVLTIGWPRWAELAAGRLAAAAALAGIAASRYPLRTTFAAYRALGSLLAVPVVFYLFANTVFTTGHGGHDSATAIAIYSYVPFIVAAGLSIFPLTAFEAAAFGAPVIVAMVASALLWPDTVDAQSSLGTIWRVLLIAGIGGLAGMSQLRFLLMVTEQATRDGLTELLVRRVGEELLAQQFYYCQRNKTPLAILFIDLDKFKDINDRYGHDAGDEVLRVAAAKLREVLRRQDILIRWGGEEFLVGLPGTDRANAETAVRRLAAAGLGRRPDGSALTACIGIAEQKADGADSLHRLLDLADQRMYAAKRAGGNRYLFRDEPVVWLGRDGAAAAVAAE